MIVTVTRSASSIATSRTTPSSTTLITGTSGSGTRSSAAHTAARVGGAPWLWTERVGQGRVIGFAGDPNYRDQWRGQLALFANAVFLGGSF